MPFLCVLAGVGGLAGCGSDDDASTASDEPQYSAASEPPKRFVERLTRLLATATTKKDCAEIDTINARSYTGFTCPAKDTRKKLSDFRIVGAEDYGTGAVVDYSMGDTKAAITLFVARDRNWGVARFGVVTKPSTDTSDGGSRKGFDDALRRYLAAVRERDCTAFVAVTFTVGAGRKAVCRQAFPGTKSMADLLKRNPSARPHYEGGNSTYGFYTLETQKPKPENVTISVVKDSESTKPYMVLDVTPSPTAADQREVREQLKQQLRARKKGDQAPKSPARKAD